LLSHRSGLRTRAGTTCQSPTIRGRRRCQLHGGLSPGAPTGSRNGNYAGGDWTREAREERQWVRGLVEFSRLAAAGRLCLRPHDGKGVAETVDRPSPAPTCPWPQTASGFVCHGAERRSAAGARISACSAARDRNRSATRPTIRLMRSNIRAQGGSIPYPAPTGFNLR
jgi:hypothetical protein